MRFSVLTIFLALGLIPLPARAGTVTHQLGWNIPTTDWVYYLDDRAPCSVAPRVTFDVGSRIFEECQFQYESPNSNRLPAYTGAAPLDWVHISHDLSMTVAGVGASGVSDSHSIFLGGIRLVENSSYSRHRDLNPVSARRSRVRRWDRR